jgi:hypothetical protein
MKLPAYNSMVRVTIREDTSWQFFKPPFVDHVVEGKLVRSAEWDPEGTIRVFTGKQDHPNAVIAIKHIVSLLDETGKAFNLAGKLARPAEDIQTWDVAGSKGNTYTVSRKGDVWRCECVGFQMRRPQFCRHIKEVRKKEGYDDDNA